jgi:acetyl-CoA carboxylase carboxyltransferase component
MTDPTCNEQSDRPSLPLSAPSVQPNVAQNWEDSLEEIRQRREYARELGGAEAVAKQRGRGRLTVRERINALVDEGSFQEVGALAGKGRYEGGKIVGVTPAPYVAGLARIDGRPVAIGGEDFTVRGGSSWGGLRRKGGQGGFSEDLALNLKMPLVNLLDGSGGSVTSTRERGYSLLPGTIGDIGTSVALLGIVPVVSAVLGTAAGGPAIRAVLSHWSVMVRGTSQVFAAGPAVVERSLGQQIDKEALGGAAVAVDVAGTVHDVATDEASCLAMIRRYLSYMPRNVWEVPPELPCDDPVDRRDEALARIIPRNRRRPYDMRRVVRMIADVGSVFEIQATYGRAVLTSLARLNGKVVGIIANNPMVNGGAVDHKAARKQTHFVELCDTFHIPLVFLVDVPGMMVGVDAELAGTLREGTRCLIAKHRATVPMLTVIVRKCYGMAGGAALDFDGLQLRIAWPSAEWGSLPLEGGVAAAYRAEIASASDPKAREKEIEDELRSITSPFRTAEAFAVEDVIDPRETRQYLCTFLDAARASMKITLGPRAYPGFHA